jgi:hypothetical protein
VIVYGFRSRNKPLGQVQYTCRSCGRSAYHGIVRSTRHFTLFWIPLIPVRNITTARCQLCGFQQQLEKQQVEALLAQPVARV